MKSIFDDETLSETLARLEKLTPDTQAQWGQMKSAQMLKHIQGPIDQAAGRLVVKVPFFFKWLGPSYARKILNGGSFGKGSPTATAYKVQTQPDFAAEYTLAVQKLKGLVLSGTARLEGVRHPFFGKLTSREWGHMQWRHLDHHLRQFGV